MRPIGLIATCLTLTCPGAAFAWGYEGHEVIADIARNYLTPSTMAKIDALLSTDTDPLTAHDMTSEATWADAYRGAGHRETASWHFVDIELSAPDLKSACFGFPQSGGLASTGPSQDCLVNKINEFAAELSDPSTTAAERLWALKYVLHFVGDVHQPLHASDNQDRGGNCLQISVGDVRTTNLHAYWDTSVVNALGKDPTNVAAKLIARISPADVIRWQSGNAGAWALESFGVAKSQVYTVGSLPGCDGGAPKALTTGYADNATKVAAEQLEKAGVRLAWVLNRALK